MKLRYFYDAGSGICLWAGDDEATEKYGYPVLLEKLPLSKKTVSIGNELINRFDTSIDREYPPGPSRWNEEEKSRFAKDSNSFYSLVVEELAHTYDIENEVGIVS